METTTKLDRNFTIKYNQLVRDYGEELARINGVSDKQLSLTDFIDTFSKTETVADASIDGSANVKRSDIVSLIHEMPKSEMKLVAFHKIYMELSKKYGKAVADDWMEKEWDGHLYLHDFHTSTFVSYCFAYDLKRMAEEGLFWLDHQNYQPPKHIETFIDFIKEFVSYTSNRQAGAVGLPNLIPYMYYFWKKDIESGHYYGTPEKFAKQEIQRFIYAINQPYVRDGLQSAFTNTSIFDHEYLYALFGSAEFPDGSAMIDEIEEIMQFQKWFLEEMSAIKSENMFTFPVNSISILVDDDGQPVDREFAEYAIRHNMKWSDSNLFVDKSVTSLSNCPMSGDTKITYWSRYYQEFRTSPIKEVYYRCLKYGIDTIKVISNGKLIDCRINQFNECPNYCISLVNGTKLQTTEHHLNKVLRGGYVETKDITTDDYLPISLTPFEMTDSLCYEDGKIVGMFLGDGSYKNNSEVVFSLNRITDADDIEFLKEYCISHFGAKVTESILISGISGCDTCVNVNVNSDYVRGLIRQFVVGDSALTKSINPRAISCSMSFRNGILDGLYTTDGGNSNRIYTSSASLRDSLTLMLSSMGIPYNIREDNRDGRLGTNPNYAIRWYTPNGRTQRKDVYQIKDGYFWFKVSSVERDDNCKARCSYCLEVVEDGVEPIFMLSNGIYTHNCRLKSNIKDLGYFNSIGGSALKVGSVKVSTINLERLALENQTEEDYLSALKSIAILDMQCLDIVRHIIKRNVEKGLLPNFQEGLLDFEHLYNTIGFIGIYETMTLFGYTRKDELGNTYYTEKAEKFGKKIFDTIQEAINEFSIDKDYTVNKEQIPGESASTKLMKKDRIFFGDKVPQDLPMLGNQFIPLGVKTTLQERVRIASLFDSFCNGGSILHANIDAPFKNFETAWKMFMYIVKQGVTYFAFNPKISSCEKNHAFYGDVCPKCGRPVKTVWSRIVGFFVPYETYSEERKEEFSQRLWENMNK